MRLVIDGTDGPESRGLMVLSALSFVADALSGLPVTILAGDDPVVHTAAQCIRWDTGLSIDIADSRADPATVMQGASLFVAVAFRSVASPYLAVAERSGTPALLLVQFPEHPAADPAVMALVRAAHDPRVLGTTIASRLGRLE